MIEMSRPQRKQQYSSHAVKHLFDELVNTFYVKFRQHSCLFVLLNNKLFGSLEMADKSKSRCRPPYIARACFFSLYVASSEMAKALNWRSRRAEQAMHISSGTCHNKERI